MQKYHLITAYNSYEKFQNFIRYFWGLSLVKEEDVIKVWENFVLAACPEADEMHVDEDDLHDFLTYLTRTWIGPINQRTGARRSPIFRHGLWNKMNAVLQGDDTTTNSSEGFNNAIQLSIPHNANVFSLIKQFRAEDALMVVKLREAAVLPDPEAGRTRTKQRDTLPYQLGRELQQRVYKELHGLPGGLLQSQLELSVSMSDTISYISI